MVFLLYSAENHHYLLRRWTGKLNPKYHLFDHSGVFEFDMDIDAVAQVLWAYAMRMGVDLVHIYEAVIDLFQKDPPREERPENRALICKWICSEIVRLRGL